MRLWRRIFGGDRAADRRTLEASAPRYDGTSVAFIGGAGTGKTHAASVELCESACTYGLPAYIQDTTGSVKLRVEGHLRWLDSKDAAWAREYADHIRRRFRYFDGRDGDAILRTLLSIVDKGSADHWMGVVLFDDCIVLRESNPRLFDTVAPLFRNAGLFGIFTMQTAKGVPPSTRTNERFVIAYRSGIPLDGTMVPDDCLNDPRSRVLRYYSPANGKRGTWDMSGPAPAELITPAAITSSEPTPFHAGPRP